MNIKWVEKSEARPTAKKMIREVDVVLDIGCGIYPQTIIQPKIHICCEPYEEYIQYLKCRVGGDKRFVFLQCKGEEVVNILPDKSVDTIFLLDVVEHLEKEVSTRIIARSEHIAREQIVIYTPIGFFPQVHIEDRKDRWGLNGGMWQAHKSGWYPEDFDDSWSIIAVREYDFDDGYGNKFQVPIGKMWAIKDLPTSSWLNYRSLRRTGYYALRASWRFAWKVSGPVIGRFANRVGGTVIGRWGRTRVQRLGLWLKTLMRRRD